MLLDLLIVNGGNWCGDKMRHGLYLNSRSPRGGAVGGSHGILRGCGALLEEVVMGVDF